MMLAKVNYTSIWANHMADRSEQNGGSHTATLDVSAGCHPFVASMLCRVSPMRYQSLCALKKAGCSKSATCRMKLAAAEQSFPEQADWMLCQCEIAGAGCIAVMKIAVSFAAFGG